MNFLRAAAAGSSLLFLLSACSPGDGQGGRNGWGKKWGDKPQGEPEAVPVRVQSLERGPISQKMLTTSTVDPVRRVDLVSKASGLVKERPVAEGDLVTAGHVIARLEDRELALALRKAEVNAAKTKADFEQMTDLLNQKIVSVDEYRKAEQAFATAQLEAETAKVALENAVLIAPIAGTLTKLDVQVGKHIAANAVLGEITDLTELECTIHVPERDVLRLAEGQPAEVASESLKNAFPARVKRVNPVIDRASGTARAILALDDATGKLKPGMFVDVSIVIETHPTALLVPKRALVWDEGRPGVFVAKGGAASWRELTLGFQERDVAEVLKGAEADEPVIVVGQNGLKEGTKIRVLGEAEAPARQ
jgi:membrane fusion protein (multidrug efflux system)